MPFRARARFRFEFSRENFKAVLNSCKDLYKWAAKRHRNSLKIYIVSVPTQQPLVSAFYHHGPPLLAAGTLRSSSPVYCIQPSDSKTLLYKEVSNTEISANGEYLTKLNGLVVGAAQMVQLHQIKGTRSAELEWRLVC